VRAILRAASGAGGAETILVPEDGPPHAEAVDRWLRRLVVAHNYGVTALHVTHEQADVAEAATARLEGRGSSARPAVVALPALAWDEDAREYRPRAGVPPPGLPLEQLVAAGGPVPPWLLDEATVALLRRACWRVPEPGVTVFMTGLSGAGKSTIARALRSRVLDRAARPVTLLDGDVVRRLLSAGLGYSREEREQNILRIGFVAAEVTRHGGLAICAAIAPHERARQRVRDMVSAVGGFVLVHVDTPLDVCESRDRKGLYQKARQGEVAAFTGVSDTYEPPADATLRIDTTRESADAAADRIFAHLVEHGFVHDTSVPESR
jgi:sulfate adenylyltransferase